MSCTEHVQTTEYWSVGDTEMSEIQSTVGC